MLNFSMDWYSAPDPNVVIPGSTYYDTCIRVQQLFLTLAASFLYRFLFLATKSGKPQNFLLSIQNHDHRLQLVSKLKIDTKIASCRWILDHLLHCRVGLGAFSVSYYRSRHSFNGRCTRYQITLPISGTVSTKIYQRTDPYPYSCNVCHTRSCVWHTLNLYGYGGRS